MLVIVRKEQEKIFVGDDLVITVCKIERGKVRLGFEAPKDLVILREEIAPEDHPLAQGSEG